MTFYSTDEAAATQAVKDALAKLDEGDTLTPEAIGLVAIDAAERSRRARERDEAQPLFSLEHAGGYQRNQQAALDNLTVGEARKALEQIKAQRKLITKRVEQLATIEALINNSMGYRPPSPPVPADDELEPEEF